MDVYQIHLIHKAGPHSPYFHLTVADEDLLYTTVLYTVDNNNAVTCKQNGGKSLASGSVIFFDLYRGGMGEGTKSQK